MGLILVSGMFTGGIVGLTFSLMLGGPAVYLAIRLSKKRATAKKIFALAFVCALLLWSLGAHFYPYPTGRPGSDYDVAMQGLFLRGFGYASGPGVAALIAWLVALLSPGR